MKKIIKSKIFWLIFVIVILVISAFVIVNIYKNNEKRLIEEEYIVSIINNNRWEVDIYLQEDYYECWRPFARYICSEKKAEVTKIEFKDKDIEEIYEDIDFDGKELEDVLIEYFNVDNESRIDINASIFSTYKLDRKTEENIINNIAKEDVNIKFLYQKLSITGDALTNYYTITFDTDGGMPIDSVVVEEGGMINELAKPTKEGYDFLYWAKDDEEYDFKSKVTSDITLTAIWEKKKTTNNNTSNNNTSNNTSNNNANNNATNNSNNTSSKINLNNNISITEYHIDSGTSNCFYYMFVTNLQEVFPNASITKTGNKPAEVAFWHTSDRQDYEVSTEEITEYTNNGTLKINTSKETSFKNALNKYKNGNYKGIANVSITEDNHRFSFSYDYISFNGLNVSSNGEAANKEIQGILASATRFKGPCGGFDSYENKILNEELCTKYNLDCDRW